jgi:hypothetical protein
VFERTPTFSHDLHKVSLKIKNLKKGEREEDIIIVTYHNLLLKYSLQPY